MDPSSGPSRRQVLRLGVVAAATAASPLTLTAPALAAPKSSRLSRSTFASHLGGTFTMVTPTTSYQAVLSSIDDLPHHPQGDPHRFRLLFTGRSTGPEQGTYTLRRSSLSQQLFVVPVGEGRRYYEAVVIS